MFLVTHTLQQAAFVEAKVRRQISKDRQQKRKSSSESEFCLYKLLAAEYLHFVEGFRGSVIFLDLGAAVVFLEMTGGPRTN